MLRAMEQSRLIRTNALDRELSRKDTSYQIDKVHLDFKSSFDTIELKQKVQPSDCQVIDMFITIVSVNTESATKSIQLIDRIIWIKKLLNM